MLFESRISPSFKGEDTILASDGKVFLRARIREETPKQKLFRQRWRGVCVFQSTFLFWGFTIADLTHR